MEGFTGGSIRTELCCQIQEEPPRDECRQSCASRGGRASPVKLENNRLVVCGSTCKHAPKEHAERYSRVENIWNGGFKLAELCWIQSIWKFPSTSPISDASPIWNLVLFPGFVTMYLGILTKLLSFSSCYCGGWYRHLKLTRFLFVCWHLRAIVRWL